MFNIIVNLSDFNSLMNKNAVLFYFSQKKCNVCKVLKPKVEALVKDEFPKIELYYIDTENFPEIAAQNSIFTVPVILIYFNGKEFFRESRNISISELKTTISKPYKILFDEL